VARAPEKPDIGQQCILALEIRSSGFGFVVVEHGRLLDWGVRGHSGEPLIAIRKLGSVLRLYKPAVVVVRRRPHCSSVKAFPSIDVVRAVRSEARRNGSAAWSVSAGRVRAFLREQGVASKHESAPILAAQFPDLSWKLLPKRKPWQGEHYFTPVFDAAATALAFLADQRSRHDVGPL
jgi:hypothetical protein